MLKKLCYILLILLMLTGCQEKKLEDSLPFDEQKETSIDEINKVDKIQETSNNTTTPNTTNNKVETTTKEETIQIPTQKETEEIPAKEEKPSTTPYTLNEQTAIATFNDIEKETDLLLKSNELDVQDKLKGLFIQMVDFLFYDGEINGVTFDGLGENAKQKVLQITASIDSKIDHSFPNYKENISSKTKEAFNKMGDLIHKGATNIKEFSKEKLGDKNYNSLIEAKDELVYYTKKAVQALGNVASDIWESSEGIRDKAKDTLKNGKDKIKNWYEDFRKND